MLWIFVTYSMSKGQVHNEHVYEKPFHGITILLSSAQQANSQRTAVCLLPMQWPFVTPCPTKNAHKYIKEHWGSLFTLQITIKMSMIRVSITCLH